MPAGNVPTSSKCIICFSHNRAYLNYYHFKATAILVTFEGDHPALFKVTQSPFFNRLILHAINAVVLFLLIIFNYTVILYYLYLFLYSFSNYLATINSFLTLIVNSAAIAGLLVGLLKLLKQFDLRRNVKLLFSLLSGR